MPNRALSRTTSRPAERIWWPKAKAWTGDYNVYLKHTGEVWGHDPPENIKILGSLRSVLGPCESVSSMHPFSITSKLLPQTSTSLRRLHGDHMTSLKHIQHHDQSKLCPSFEDIMKEEGGGYICK